MPALELTIGKVAVSGVSKLAGIGAPTLLGHWSRRRLLAKTAKVHVGPTAIAPYDDVDAGTISAIHQLCNSSEFANYSLSIANALLLRECGGDPENRLRDLKNQFITGLKVSGAAADCSDVAGQVFDALQDAVTKEVAALRDLEKSGLPVGVKNVILRSAAQTAAAESRNNTLIESITSIDQFHAFKTQLRSQISALHRTMRLPHAGTTRQVPYERLFVAPTIDRADQSMLDTDNEITSLTEHCESALRLVILGDPGGGKSTLALKETFDQAASSSADAVVPFLVVLRDYAPHLLNQKMSVMEYLEALCETPYSVKPPEGALEYLLLNGHVTVLFDGLDELLDTSQRRDVVSTVEGFAHRYPTAQIIVTSRRVGYEEAALDDKLFATASLREFEDDQVEAYARKWFSLDESHPRLTQQTLTDSFLVDSIFVRDLRVNPLMLSLMCGIYASEHYIPRNRPDVYEKCALLLFDRWDKQRGIDAPLAFDAHVQGAMRALALWLYPKQESQSGLPRAKLVEFITEYLLAKRFDDHDEAANAAVEFIDFCKGRAWVLTDVGSDLYGFTHRTFLEYFAASQLARLSPSANLLYDELRPHVVAQEWDVVAQLALQILGKNVEDGADDFLRLLCEDKSNWLSASALHAAASFAARSLEFIVPRPPVLRQIVKICVDSTRNVDEIPDYRSAYALNQLLCASAENLPLIDKYLREAVLDELRNSTSRHIPDPLKVMWFAPANAYSSTGLSSNREFWSSDLENRRAEFLPTMLESFDSTAWVAIELAESGHRSILELFTKHGTQCFWEMISVSQSRYLYSKAAQLITYLTSNQSNVRLDKLVSQLHEELPKRRKIWMGLSDDGSSRPALGSQLYWLQDTGFTTIPKDPIKLAVFLMLLLPYLEASPSLGPGLIATAPPLELLSDARTLKLPAQGVRQGLEELKLGREATEFLLEWARRGFSVCSKSLRRTGRTGRPLLPRENE